MPFVNSKHFALSRHRQRHDCADAHKVIVGIACFILVGMVKKLGKE